MKKLNQKGFGAIEVILAIVLIIGIVVIGYFVWQSNKNNDKIDKNMDKVLSLSDNQPSKKAKTQPKPNDTVQPKQHTKKYLAIKEWGVEIPLSSGIQDAYYIYNSGDAKLGTRSLTAMSANCAADKIGVSIMSRQTVDTHDANARKDDPALYPVNSTKIGNYYYGISHAQAACSDTIYSAASKQQATDFNLFNTAFQGIQTVQ